MSKAHKGKYTGKDHSNWKGGISRKPEYQKSLYLKCVYGITINQYKKMLEEQNGVCAICGKPEMKKSKKGWIYALQIDHNHQTNKVRGLLCQSCNTGLSNFKDNTESILRAVEYLKGR